MVIHGQEYEHGEQETQAIGFLQCFKYLAEQVLIHHALLIFGADVCCLQLIAQGRHLVQGHQMLFDLDDAA